MMQSSRTAFSAATALHRVFIAPIERTTLSKIRQQTQPAQLKLYPTAVQQRSYAAPSTPQIRRLPRDDEIKAPYVHIVGEDGKLSEPQSVGILLRSLNPQTHTLVTMAMPSQVERRPQGSSQQRTGGRPTGQSQQQMEEEEAEQARKAAQPKIPICRILEKKALREAEKQRMKKKRDNPTTTVKQLELNWAIDNNDLNHRVAKMKTFLAKGWRVEIMLAAKKKGRKASLDEAQAVLDQLRKAIASVEGSKEWKVMEGKIGEQAIIYAQGKIQAKA